MTSYSLRQISASVWNITSNRTKVGFVRQVPTGYAARIGSHLEIRKTPEVAFEAVVSKALGFSTPSALAAHNQEVRAKNLETKARVRHAADEALVNKNFEPLFDLLFKPTKK